MKEQKDCEELEEMYENVEISVIRYVIYSYAGSRSLTHVYQLCAVREALLIDMNG